MFFIFGLLLTIINMIYLGGDSMLRRNTNFEKLQAEIKEIKADNEMIKSSILELTSRLVKQDEILNGFEILMQSIEQASSKK